MQTISDFCFRYKNLLQIGMIVYGFGWFVRTPFSMWSIPAMFLLLGGLDWRYR